MPTKVPYARTTPVLTDAQQQREYDRNRRDPAARAFYTSLRWRKTRALKLANNPLCESCRSRGMYVAATMVHHSKGLGECHEHALDMDTLVSLCTACHNREHKRIDTRVGDC
jgi:5-methylcytosine-specific restriction endonuclease McrA